MADRDPTRRPISLTRQSFQETPTYALGERKKGMWWEHGFVSTPIGKFVFLVAFLLMTAALLQSILMSGSELGFFLGWDLSLTLQWLLIYNGIAWFIALPLVAHYLLPKAVFMGKTYYLTGEGQVSGGLWYARTLRGTRLIAASYVKVTHELVIPGQSGAGSTQKESYVTRGRTTYILYYGEAQWLDDKGTRDRRLLWDTLDAYVWSAYHKEGQYVHLAAENAILKRTNLMLQENRGSPFQSDLAAARSVVSG